MQIILDTHVFLWAIADPDRLNEQRRYELESPGNTVYVSAVSITEIIIKASMGKLSADFDPLAVAIDSGFEPLDYTAQDALCLKDLPYHHRDPFDRMLIAQSINTGHPLMSDDRKFTLYDCRLL